MTKLTVVMLGLSSVLVSPRLAVAGAAPAPLTVTGAVQCAAGRNVVGVWVASTGAGSGWASWKDDPGRDDVAYYSRTITSAVAVGVALHVGCGGTARKWLADDRMPGRLSVSPGRQFVINALACGTDLPTLVPGRTLIGSCSLPPAGKGGSLTSDPGDPGNCTCGAAFFWKENTGSYPAWGGNANVWADASTGAPASGWDVVDFPVPHALVVWPSGRFGHVAWVTGINWRTSTLRFIDMNGGNWTDPAAGVTSLLGQWDAKTCSLSTSSCTSARLPKLTMSLTGTEYIVATNGPEWSWGPGPYPSVPSDCA